MLIEFSVKNFRSIQAVQVLSLVVAKGNELGDSNTFTPDALATDALLRSAVIYGPNAAGKSNLVKAMGVMRYIVLNSGNAQPRRGLPIVPFLLDEGCVNAPSEFEIIFVAEGVRYQYGFSANAQHIIEEWLIAFPHGRAQRWLSRVWDAQQGAHHWQLGKGLTGPKQTWQTATRDNALFLSTAAQLNSKQLKPVFDWFALAFRVIGQSGMAGSFTAEACLEEHNQAYVLAFLQAADLDIANLDIQIKQLTEQDWPKHLPADLKAGLLQGESSHKVLEIKTLHTNQQGQTVAFRLEDESDGTRKLFELAGPWLDVLRNGYTVVIDELNSSLHPMLLKSLVQMFHHPKTNPNNAQLIFTTHDTSILNQAIFRRDQIWFCEKNKAQATQIYPLTDFHPRKERENLEAGYLDGRYGGVPIVDTSPPCSNA